MINSFFTNEYLVNETPERLNLDFLRPEYPIEIIIKNKLGVVKDSFFVGEHSRLVKCNFVINEKGTSTGNFEFYNLDINIYAQDIIITNYKGRAIYSGIVLNKPDGKLLSIRTDPLRKVLQNAIYEGSNFVDTRAIDILRTVIESKALSPFISFSDEAIIYDFINSQELFSLDATRRNYIDIIEDTVNFFPGGNEVFSWGVNQNFVFFVNKNRPILTKSWYFYEDVPYTAIDAENNYDDIEITRAFVYKKVNNESIFVGKVGFEDTPLYPPITALENVAGILEGDIIIIETNVDDIALDLAYNRLLTQNIEKLITLEKYNPDIRIPDIFEYWQVQDSEYRQFTVVSEVETIQQYTANTYYVDNIWWYHSVGGKITVTSESFFGNKALSIEVNTGNIVHIDFIAEINTKTINYTIKAADNDAINKKYDVIFYKKINNTYQEGAQAYATRIARFEEIYRETHVLQTTEWETKKVVLPESQKIIAVGFEFYDFYNIYIDQFTVFMYNKPVYRSNIKNIKYTIDSNNILCNINMGNKQRFLTRDTKMLQTRQQKLTEITRG